MATSRQWLSAQRVEYHERSSGGKSKFASCEDFKAWAFIWTDETHPEGTPDWTGVDVCRDAKVTSKGKNSKLCRMNDLLDFFVCLVMILSNEPTNGLSLLWLTGLVSTFFITLLVQKP